MLPCVNRFFMFIDGNSCRSCKCESATPLEFMHSRPLGSNILLSEERSPTRLRNVWFWLGSIIHSSYRSSSASSQSRSCTLSWREFSAVASRDIHMLTTIYIQLCQRRRTFPPLAEGDPLQRRTCSVLQRRAVACLGASA